MSRISKILVALATAGMGMFSVSTAANAFTVVGGTGLTDDGFKNMLRTGEFTELFVAESRIGNNGFGGNQERELGINEAIKPNGMDFVGGTPLESGHRVWEKGVSVDFVLEYTGSLVKYTVGGQLLSSTAFSGLATDIFLRTHAAKNTTATLSDLFFNGTGINQILSSTGVDDKDIDYLQIADITAPFRLTGKSNMSWTDATPSRSNLAYQIKVGTTPTEVPEPGTVGALLLTGLLAVGSRKQQKAS